MTRYTRKDAEAAFDRLCAMLGKTRVTRYERGEDGTYAQHVGQWRLDYNGVYGGYVVEEIANGSLGITHPLGHQRYPARQFVEMVTFARDVLHVAETVRFVPSND